MFMLTAEERFSFPTAPPFTQQWESSLQMCSATTSFFYHLLPPGRISRSGLDEGCVASHSDRVYSDGRSEAEKRSFHPFRMDSNMVIMDNNVFILQLFIMLLLIWLIYLKGTFSIK